MTKHVLLGVVGGGGRLQVWPHCAFHGECKILFLWSATGKHKSTSGDRRQLRLQHFDENLTQVCFVETCVSFAVFVCLLGGLLNRNPYWEITQQVTHFHPAKANPLIAPSFQTTISINHPAVCPSPPSCCPALRPSGELPSEIGVSWLKALRLFAVFGMFGMYCSEPSPSVFWSSPCSVSQSQQRSGGRDCQQQLRPLAGRRLGALAASIAASCTLVNEHRWVKKKPKHS